MPVRELSLDRRWEPASARLESIRDFCFSRGGRPYFSNPATILELHPVTTSGTIRAVVHLMLGEVVEVVDAVVEKRLSLFISFRMIKGSPFVSLT